MKLTKATVIVNPGGLDNVILETDLPDPIYPYKGVACLRLDTASQTGKDYVAKNFPEIEKVEVIDRTNEGK